MGTFVKEIEEELTQKLNSELERLHKFQADMECQFLRPGESNLKWQ